MNTKCRDTSHETKRTGHNPFGLLGCDGIASSGCYLVKLRPEVELGRFRRRRLISTDPNFREPISYV